MSLDQIDSVEIVGGGSRVPWFKEMCSKAFGGKPLSTTMNQEESVARGCALQAAILSPLYKVRDFKVDDACPFPVEISFTGAAEKKENGDAEKEETDVKPAAIFPSGSSMNMV